MLRRVVDRFGYLVRGFSLLELLVGHEVRTLATQLLRTVPRPFGLVTVGPRLKRRCFGGRQGRARLRHLGLVLRRIDAQHEVPPLHEVAFLHGDVNDPARDVGADVHRALWLDLAARRDGRNQVAPLDLRDTDRLAAVPPCRGVQGNEDRDGDGATAKDQEFLTT